MYSKLLSHISAVDVLSHRMIWSLESVTAEVLLLAPFAAVVVLRLYHNCVCVFGEDVLTMALLILAGPLTAIPLILFSFAARRLATTTTGLLQYINSTLQFACAIFIFVEPFGPWHMIAFALIWAALGFYSASALRQDNTRCKAARAAALSGTTL